MEQEIIKLEELLRNYWVNGCIGSMFSMNELVKLSPGKIAQIS